MDIKKILILLLFTTSLFAQISDSWTTEQKQFARKGYVDDKTDTLKSWAIGKYTTIANVKDYGAVGDSVTDDKSAFTNALSYLNSQGGGILLIPEGVYNAGVNNNYSNITFMAIGRVKIVNQVWHFSVGKNPLVGAGDGNYSATIQYSDNCDLVGKFIFGKDARLGCFFNRNSYIENVTFEEASLGLHIYFGSEDMYIDNCLVDTNGCKSYAGMTGAVFVNTDATNTYYPQNIVFNNLTIRSAYLHGFYGEMKDSKINNLVIKNAGYSGLRLTECDGISIGSVSISDCGILAPADEMNKSDISIDNSTNISIDNAVCSGGYHNYVDNTNVTNVSINRIYALSATNSSVYVRGQFVTIKDALINNSGNYGLYLVSSKYFMANNIKSIASTKSGAIITGTNTDVNISSMSLIDNTENGILIGGSGGITIGSILSDGNYFNGLRFTGLTGTLTINSLISKGGHASSYYNGLAAESSSGHIMIGKFLADGYTTSNCSGIYASAITGNMTIDEARIINNAIGLKIQSDNVNIVKTISSNNTIANQNTYRINSLFGGVSSFSTTALIDTVSVIGLGQYDAIIATPNNSTSVLEQLTIQNDYANNRFFTRRDTSTISGLNYNWIRIQR